MHVVCLGWTEIFDDFGMFALPFLLMSPDEPMGDQMQLGTSIPRSVITKPGQEGQFLNFETLRSSSPAFRAQPFQHAHIVNAEHE